MIQHPFHPIHPAHHSITPLTALSSTDRHDSNQPFPPSLLLVRPPPRLFPTLPHPTPSPSPSAIPSIVLVPYGAPAPSSPFRDPDKSRALLPLPSFYPSALSPPLSSAPPPPYTYRQIPRSHASQCATAISRSISQTQHGARETRPSHSLNFAEPSDPKNIPEISVSYEPNPIRSSSPTPQGQGCTLSR